MSAIGDAGLGCGGGVPLGWAWGPSWGVGGGGLLFGKLGVFLSRTGESANQAHELEVREEEEEEEEGMRPQRPMLTMEMLNWGHSPPAHG